jgi:hypothetical protein
LKEYLSNVARVLRLVLNIKEQQLRIACSLSAPDIAPRQQRIWHLQQSLVLRNAYILLATRNDFMRGLKVALIVLGSIIGLVLIALIVLYVAGGQTVVDPFTSGIDVTDAPFTVPGTVTWRLVGAPDATKTLLYVSEVSRPAADGFSPEDLGYTQSFEPRIGIVEGVRVYRADVSRPSFVRVYAYIDGDHKWSIEYEMTP